MQRQRLSGIIAFAAAAYVFAQPFQLSPGRCLAIFLPDLPLALANCTQAHALESLAATLVALALATIGFWAVRSLETVARPVLAGHESVGTRLLAAPSG